MEEFSKYQFKFQNWVLCFVMFFFQSSEEYTGCIQYIHFVRLITMMGSKSALLHLAALMILSSIK